MLRGRFSPLLEQSLFLPVFAAFLLLTEVLVCWQLVDAPHTINDLRSKTDRGRISSKTPDFCLWKTRPHLWCVDSEVVLLFPRLHLHPVEPGLLCVFCLRGEGQVSSTLCDFPCISCLEPKPERKQPWARSDVTDSKTQTIWKCVGGGGDGASRVPVAAVVMGVMDTLALLKMMDRAAGRPCRPTHAFKVNTITETITSCSNLKWRTDSLI